MGKHLLIDCNNVPQDVCANDKLVLETMAKAAAEAGANVISQVRYKFGHNSPAGFTAFVLLDESHISAHCYEDTGKIAFDIFTCGDTNPWYVLELISRTLDLGDMTAREEARFTESATMASSGLENRGPTG